VNPIVAVILGWLLAGEVINARMGVAAAIIVSGVALITAAEGRSSAKAVRRDDSLTKQTADFTIVESA
jgi:drug/metabolite transporter (DMT)-like permease